MGFLIGALFDALFTKGAAATYERSSAGFWVLMGGAIFVLLAVVVFLMLVR